VTRAIDAVAERLRAAPAGWLVTGAAGFIGSHLVAALLRLGQTVTGLDNFSTGRRANLDHVRSSLNEADWRRFRFVEADITDPAACRAACAGVDYVLHQAALGSVPRSIADPLATNAANVDGFLGMLEAARQAGVRRFVYAASSSTYGDHPDLPKKEDRIGSPLSPYAVTKLVNELYADVFARCYGFGAVGLRYFNVFGPRQDPDGAYAAVIPKWIGAMIDGQHVTINGDGQTSRDFCFVRNVIEANLLAAVGAPDGARVYNVAVGGRTTLVELFEAIRDALAREGVSYSLEPVFAPTRAGDVRHSQADVTRARVELGYDPIYDLRKGLVETMPYYLAERAGR